MRRRARRALVAAALTLGGAAIVPPSLPPLPGLPRLPVEPPRSDERRPPPPPPRPSRDPVPWCVPGTPSGRVPYKAPVFDCDVSDPMVLGTRAGWFAYATAAGWERDGRTFPVLRSGDLRHWRLAGDALAQPPHWAIADLWGPSVIAWRGRYLLFFSARDGASREHCLGVATARGAQGPFTPRRRIGCRSHDGSGFIDPAPLVAADGRLYLFFSVDRPRHSISVVRLSRDGLSAQGWTTRVLPVSSRWGPLRAPTVEAPSPLYRRGRYYLFYSAGSWTEDYRMAYAVARKPLGPYRDLAPVALLSATGDLPSPGGGSVVTGRRGATWLAFNAWSGPPGYQNRSKRTMRIAPISWDRRGGARLVLDGGA